MRSVRALLSWVAGKVFLPVLAVIVVAVAAVWVFFNAALTAAVARDLAVGGPNGWWIDIPLGGCGTVFFAAMAGVPVGAVVGMSVSFHERAGRAGFVLGVVLGGIGLPWLLWHLGTVPPLADFAPTDSGD